MCGRMCVCGVHMSVLVCGCICVSECVCVYAHVCMHVVSVYDL